MAELNIPITKAKSALTIDTDKIPEDVYREALLQGLKVLLNRGASKVTATSIPDEEARKAEAMAVAEKQLELVMTSKIKFTGGKAKKASGAVMTEARRLAKGLVKQAMKEQGIKVSHVEASEITKAANMLLDTDQGKEILAQAEQNIKDREKTPIAIDIKAIVHESPKLVAKAAAAKREKKDQLSAKQAGKPQVRTRGQGAPAATQ